jgi:hypothetical protein
MKKLQVITLSTTLLLLAACVHPMLQETQDNVSDVQHQTERAKKRYHDLNQGSDKMAVFRHAYKYVKPQQPRWLKQHVELHAQQAPLNFLMQKMLRQTPAYASFSNDVSERRRLNLNYRGSVQGALDAVSARTGYGYSVDQNTVTWSQYVTRTFDISFMPGDAAYSLGETTAHSLSTPTLENTNEHKTQFSNLRGNLSLWHDLFSTLDQIKSEHGKVIVSQATTSVTVSDKPENIRAIEQYLRDLNRRLSREVALQVQVLEVDLNTGFNYGVN